MKFTKTVALILALSLSLLSLVSCGEDIVNEKPDYYTVTLDYNNGTEPHTVRVAANAYMAQPQNPEKEGYIFNGWRNGSAEWIFTENTVYKDITLVANWIDASTIFEYTPNGDGTVTVVEYSGALSAVRVPEIISGYSVSAVADDFLSDLLAGKILEITLPKTVQSIGANAFLGCADIPITVSGEISYLGEAAFSGCNELSAIALADGLGAIPFNAFSGCSSLGTVSIPESVTLIEENAFYGCSSMQTIVIAARELTVENGAFSGCDALKTVFFLGSEAEWDAIASGVDNGGGENSALLDAKVYFYSETEADGDYWYFNANGEPRCW